MYLASDCPKLRRLSIRHISSIAAVGHVILTGRIGGSRVLVVLPLDIRVN